jgi:hypothetical protein
VTATTADTDRRDNAVEQLFQAAIGALELLHVYVGDRLGLYTALAEESDATPAELATRAGIAERYAREWLEEQAVAGLGDSSGPASPTAGQTFQSIPGLRSWPGLCSASSPSPHEE